jgi:hypothetical protein
VRSDEEVGDDAFLPPSRSAIRAPHLTGAGRHLRVESGEPNVKAPEHLIGSLGGTEQRRDLSPYDLARHHHAFSARRADRLPRGWAESRVRRQDVDEHARVDGGYQTASTSPRISPMSSSVDRLSWRTP